MAEQIDKEKKKKPTFKPQGTHHKRVKNSWRKPRGIDSKQRKGKKETPKTPKIGYRQPKKIRGLHPSGYTDNLIYNTKELKELNPEKDAVRIAATVGKKKRKKIIEKAEEKNLKIINKGSKWN